MKTSPFIRLERKIAAGERGDILDRWRYGRLLREAKAGRKQLPHGMIADLVAAAKRAGVENINEREIQRRLQCAEAYDSESKCAQAGRTFGSWSALREAGFPPVEMPPGSDHDEIEASGLAVPPDEWQQLQLDIPGLKQTISIRGRKVELVRGPDGATVADVAAYRDMCREMHENFGKTVAQIEETLATMREGAAGDDQANAVEAWEAATGGTADDVDDIDEVDGSVAS